MQFRKIHELEMLFLLWQQTQPHATANLHNTRCKKMYTNLLLQTLADFSLRSLLAILSNKAGSGSNHRSVNEAGLREHVIDVAGNHGSSHDTLDRNTRQSLYCIMSFR